MPVPDAPLWSSAAASEAAFAEEQEILGATWTFVGFLGAIPNNNDWIRAKLGGRSIFIQRFGEDIRGFENRCAHRFFPLRTADRGNGQIVCGFHHWRYNKDGLALGIPMCEEYFGKTPRELNASLQTVEISICGSLIFGRFSRSVPGVPLATFLGDAFPLLETICPPGIQASYIERPIAANWKFSHHISLDDYHIVAVHPQSFGKDGYLNTAHSQYSRIGPHSIFIASPIPDSMSRIMGAIGDGSFRPDTYFIVNLFPNLVVAMVHIGRILGVDYWNTTVMHFVPDTFQSSTLRVWTFPAPFPANLLGVGRFTHPIVSRCLPYLISRGLKKVINEDAVACEKLQTNAAHMNRDQILSSLECRIGWFEEAYAQAMVEGRGQSETNHAASAVMERQHGGATPGIS